MKVNTHNKCLHYLDFLLNIESCAECLAGSVIELHQEALQRLLVHGCEVGERLHACVCDDVRTVWSVVTRVSLV